jgi:hypothetical protein
MSNAVKEALIKSIMMLLTIDNVADIKFDHVVLK